MKVKHTNSAAETRALGRRLARFLRQGDVLALEGELGAGKTTFIQGVADGLGIHTPVRSPSFVLMTVHVGSYPLYHIDAYRVSDVEIEDAGIDEVFDGTGVVAVEWADRLQNILPESHLTLVFTWEGETVRRVELTPSDSELAERFEPW